MSDQYRCKNCGRMGEAGEPRTGQVQFEWHMRVLSATQTEKYLKCLYCNSDNVKKVPPRYYVDIKETAWRRVMFELPEDMTEQQLIKKMDEEGTDWVWEYEYDSETDCLEEMNPSENDGLSTKELYRDDYSSSEILWQNGEDAVQRTERTAKYRGTFLTKDEVL